MSWVAGGRDRRTPRLPDDVVAALMRGPGVGSVRLVGSRADGRAGPSSDWDFHVATEDFRKPRRTLPALVSGLDPVLGQWDRLSDTCCYMMLLTGPVKVDLIFDQPHRPLPPWRVNAATLVPIDAHFWDWALWLNAKQRAGKTDLVASELVTLHEHLLGPLGAPHPARSLHGAVRAYGGARQRRERELGVRVPRTAERAVRPALDEGQAPS